MEINSTGVKDASSGADIPVLTGGRLTEEKLSKLKEMNMVFLAKGILAAEAQIQKAQLDLVKGADKQEKERDKENQDGGEPSRDEAVISRDSRLYASVRGDTKAMDPELEARLARLLEALKGWRPQQKGDLEAQLNSLSEIYRTLILEIAKNCAKSEQLIWMDRLNQVIAQDLQKLSDALYPNLLKLFSTYGREGADAFLMASIMGRIAGAPVSPREFMGRVFSTAGTDGGDPEAVWEKSTNSPGRTANGGTSPGQHSPQSAVSGQRAGITGEGVLYRHVAGNKVSANAAYQEQLSSMERLAFKNPGVDGQRLSLGAVTRGFERSYAPSDVEKAEAFVRYMDRGGNLYGNPQFTAGNEELMGFLMALTMMKAEVFSGYTGVEKNMGRDIRDALQKLADYYINLAGERAAGQNRRGAKEMDWKAINRVYHYMMGVFRRFKSPRRAVEDGLNYAMDLFAEKKKEKKYIEDRRYGKDAGFFESLLLKKSGKREIEEGKKALREDWDDFLDSIGQRDNELLQLVFSSYSPWGILMDPAEIPGGRFHISAVVAAAAAITAVLLVLVSFYR